MISKVFFFEVTRSGVGNGVLTTSRRLVPTPPSAGGACSASGRCSGRVAVLLREAQRIRRRQRVPGDVEVEGNLVTNSFFPVFRGDKST